MHTGYFNQKILMLMTTIMILRIYKHELSTLDGF